ncbi:hypothetical protein ACVI1J_005068 [Bradyrhizobium diazoefficiens]
MIVVVMAVIMMRMVIVAMRMTGVGIGATFRIEWRLDLDDTRAEALHHGLDDVVAADAQGFGHDLRRQMTIAEVPADADEVVRIAAADLEQRLGRRNHFDQPAVLQHQRVAAAQRNGVLQVEQEFEPPRPRHRHAAAVPIVEIEHDRVHWCFGEAVLSPNLRRPDHWLLPCYRVSTFSGVMISTFGGAMKHFTAMRPNVFMCSMARCGTSASALSYCSTNTILVGSVTLSCIS